MIDRVISIIDTHTAGEPTRIIVGGLPRIRGNSMLEKRDYFEKNYDQIRTMILREPRGHNDMFGAALVEPVHPDADLGVIFLSTGDYPRAYPYMCGYGAISLISAAVELGMVKKTAPLTKVLLDTPDGLVTGWATVKNDPVIDVEIENVPAFLHKKDLQISTTCLMTEFRFMTNQILMVFIWPSAPAATSTRTDPSLDRSWPGSSKPVKTEQITTVTLMMKHTGFNLNTGFFSRNRDIVGDSSFSVLG